MKAYVRRELGSVEVKLYSDKTYKRFSVKLKFSPIRCNKPRRNTALHGFLYGPGCNESQAQRKERRQSRETHDKHGAEEASSYVSWLSIYRMGLNNDA